MITTRGKPVTLAEIAKIKLKQPDKKWEKVGKYWKGIPHIELIRAIVSEFDRRGWLLKSETYALSKSGCALAASFNLQMKLLPPEGQQFCVGLTTANDRHQKLRIVVGTTVIVCDNGMVSGEMVFSRKHTTGFELSPEIVKAMDWCQDRFGDVKDYVKFLQKKILCDSEVDCILMQAGRDCLMPWSRIGDVDDYYHTPSHEEFDSRTAWSLLNAFTSVVKKNPPLQQIYQITKFRELLHG